MTERSYLGLIKNVIYHRQLNCKLILEYSRYLAQNIQYIIVNPNCRDFRKAR